jgi:hypothetical protein
LNNLDKIHKYILFTKISCLVIYVKPKVKIIAQFREFYLYAMHEVYVSD